MTRLDAGILAQLTRGPYTTLDIGLALDETLARVRKACESLETKGQIEWTLDGWKLTDKVAA